MTFDALAQVDTIYSCLRFFHAIKLQGYKRSDVTNLSPHRLTGPSAPRDVTVRLVTPRLVEIRWRRPAVSNGQIIRYTVYAIPITVSGPAISKRQAAPNLPSRTITQVCSHMWMCTLISRKYAHGR